MLLHSTRYTQDTSRGKGGPIGSSRASTGTPGAMATGEILRTAMESARRGHRTSQSSQGYIALSRLAFPAAPLLSLLRRRRGECSGRLPRVLCAVDVQVALTETLGRPVIASAGVSASQSDALVRGVGNEMDTSTS